MAIYRYFFRNTQTNAGTGGIRYDLSTTRGTEVILTSSGSNQTTFTEALSWGGHLGTAVTGTSFPTSIRLSAISGTVIIRWRLQRVNVENGLINASSAYTPEFTATAGQTYTSTISFPTSWNSWSGLRLSLEWRATSMGGSNVNVNVNHLSSWVDVDRTAIAVLPPVSASVVATHNNQSLLLGNRPSINLAESTAADQPTVIEVDTSVKRQHIVGFGAAMTESSGKVISDLPESVRNNLMNDLFSPTTGLGLSFVRLPIGASDFALGDYTYADVQGPAGDPLANFSIAREDTYVVPRLQQALAINPKIKFVGSPWSPPAWMKTGGTLKGNTGGILIDSWMPTYAQYFVKYVQAMRARGINIDYVTPQNEPEHDPFYIGMKMSAEQQIIFIRDHLAPAFAEANLRTKILGFDHNWDNPNYSNTLLNDAGTKAVIGGIAWHGYLGEPSAQTTVRNAHPTIDHFFTEITEHGTANFSEDLRWNTRTITIGSLANWSRSALLWNLALDQNNGPQNGSATDVRGLMQVNNSTNTYQPQPAYYSLGQASKFITQGSYRVARTSSNPWNIIHTEAYVTPDAKVVLHVLNDGGTPQICTVKWGSRKADVELVTGVSTLTWDTGVLSVQASTIANTFTFSAAQLEQVPVSGPVPVEDLQANTLATTFNFGASELVEVPVSGPTFTSGSELGTGTAPVPEVPVESVQANILNAEIAFGAAQLESVVAGVDSLAAEQLSLLYEFGAELEAVTPTVYGIESSLSVLYAFGEPELYMPEIGAPPIPTGIQVTVDGTTLIYTGYTVGTPTTNAVLMEDGSEALMEDGSPILMEA